MKIPNLLKIIKKTITFLKHLLPVTWYGKLTSRQKLYVMTGVVAFLLVLIPSVIYTLSNATKSEATWYDDSWKNRKQLVFNNSAQDEDLTNFKVLVKLTPSNFDFAKAATNGADIRFTDSDGTTLLDYEIEKFDQFTRQGYIWVEVPQIDASSTTDSIFIYYGNPYATDAQSKTTTWSSTDYSLVYHLADPAGTTGSGSVNDSTGNTSGTPTTGIKFNQAGKVGPAVDFSSGTGISLGTVGSSILTADTTISYWMYINSCASPSRQNPYDQAFGGWSTMTLETSCALSWYMGSNGGNDVPYSNYASSVGLQGQWVYITAVRDSSDYSYKWYKNGAYLTGNTYDSSYPAINDRTFTIGDGYVNPLNGKLDEFRVEKVARSADWIAAEYKSMNDTFINYQGEETSKGPVAYWKFDEGYGTTAHDSTTSKNNGTITGATWQSENQCISSKCLFFDGTDDYVSAGNPSNLQFDTSAFSVSVWAKTTKAIANSTWQGIISKGGYNSGFELRFSVDANGTRYVDGWIADETFGTQYDFQPNTWYQITFTRDNSGNYNLYINGNNTVKEYENTVSKSIGTSNWEIGRMRGSNTYPFKGYIDDVKVYNYERTAEQIRADYTSRGSVKGVSSQIGGDNELSDALSNGLVGYWKMDEDSGNLIDSSGNGYTSTVTGTSVTNGKFANGRDHNGSSDSSTTAVSSLPTSSGSKFTVAFWMNWDGTGSNQMVMNFGGSSSMDLFFIGTSHFGINTYASDIWGIAPTGLSGGWKHVVFVINNGDITSSEMYINGVKQTMSQRVGTTVNTRVPLNTNVYMGSGPSSYYYDGKLDEVRIYNRGLSSSEVSALYNWAPGPVGYWSFEDASGSTVADSSGNSNNGTWYGTGSHWTTGKYGKGGSFNGSDDYVSLSNNVGNFGTGDFTIESWIKFPLGGSSTWNGIVSKGFTTSAPANTWGIATGNPVTNLHFLDTNDTAGVFNVNYPFTNVPSSGWHHITVTRTSGTSYKFYVDGIYNGAVTSSSIANLSNSTNLQFGNASGRYLKSSLDEVKVYNYARTPGQIVEDMNAGHPTGGSPIASQVGYWKFDKGHGTTVYNSGYGGSILNGTITSATWNNNGKFGKALSFNGSSSYVTVTENNALDPGTGDWSYGAWFKTTATGALPIIYKYTSTEYYSLRVNSGQIQSYFKVDDTIVGSQTTESTYNDGNWHHVMVSCDRDGNMNLYVDNILKDSDSLSSVSGLDLNNSANLLIGYVSGSYFSGTIDEVKIYNSALTADQIKLEYNQGKSLVLGSSSDTSNLTGGSVASNSASSLYCVPGSSDTCSPPVAEWNFEEGKGTTLNDLSGNGNTGTITGATWTKGKAGKALSFTNDGDGVSAGSSSTTAITGDLTLEAWVYPTTSTGWAGIVSRWGGNWAWALDTTSHKNAVWINSTNGWRYSNSNIPINTWSHVAVVYSDSSDTVTFYLNGIYDGSSSQPNNPSGTTGPLTIGQWGNNYYFKGKIDEARVFNYARTPAQVAWDYNQGKPIGHWKMDECQGTTAYDSSGRKINGSIIIGTSSTQSSAGTCQSSGTAWYNGATGKYNSSLNFDGTDDYIAATDSANLTNGLTISTWYKTSSFAYYNTLFNRGAQGSGNGFVWITRNTTTSNIVYQQGNASYCSLQSNANAFVSDGNWHNFTVTHDKTSNYVYMYKDGIKVGEGSCTWVNISNSNEYIGTYNGQTNDTYVIKGQMDDVRIYNYALTEAQVKNVMNQGAAVRWGPSQGSP